MQVKAASLYSGNTRTLEVISISKAGRKVVVSVPEFATGKADFYRNAEGLYKNEYMGLVFRMPEPVQAEPEEQAEAVPQCSAVFSVREYETGRAYGLPAAKASCNQGPFQVMIVRRKLVKVSQKHRKLAELHSGMSQSEVIKEMARSVIRGWYSVSDAFPVKPGKLTIRGIV